MISTEQLYQTLQQRFGFSRFRPGQLEALTALTAKHNTLAVLPTGAGKRSFMNCTGLSLNNSY
jgi:Superfamily II DNA helicase